MIGGRDLGLVDRHNHTEHAYSAATDEAPDDHGRVPGTVGLEHASDREQCCANAHRHAATVLVGEVGGTERSDCGCQARFSRRARLLTERANLQDSDHVTDLTGRGLVDFRSACHRRAQGLQKALK